MVLVWDLLLLLIKFIWGGDMNNFINGQIVYYIIGGTLQQGIFSQPNNIVYGINFEGKAPEIDPDQCCSHYYKDVLNLLTAFAEKPKIQFTAEQQDFICYQIGDWYLTWKDGIANKDGTHRLGYAKEELKTMICGDEYA